MKNIFLASLMVFFMLFATAVLLKPQQGPNVLGTGPVPGADDNSNYGPIHILPALLKTYTDQDLPKAGGAPGAGTAGGAGGTGTTPSNADDAAFNSRMGGPGDNGYYTMPDPVGDEYSLAHALACRHGSKELLTLINRVAFAWKAKYPDSRLEVWDINASGHLSHRNGIDVDLAITDESAANMCSAAYSEPGDCGGGLSKGQCRSIEFGKMILETNQVQIMFYDDTTVDDAINAYARDSGKTNFSVIEPWGTQACGAGHHNHFHVRVLDSYKLATWEPAGC